MFCEGIWGSVGVASLILNLNTRCRQVVNFTPQSLTPWGRTYS
jgi:hypothetical protein